MLKLSLKSSKKTTNYIFFISQYLNALQINQTSL